MQDTNNCALCGTPITHYGKGHKIKKQNYGICHDHCVDWIREMVDGIFVDCHEITHKAFLKVMDRLEIPRTSIFFKSTKLKQ